MSIPTREENKAEWLNTKMRIEVTIHDNSIYRDFKLTDGEFSTMPIAQAIEEMKEELLNTSEF